MAETKTQIDIAKIDEEIKQLDEKIAAHQQVVQRRSDLVNLKLLLQRLYGIDGHEPPVQVASGNGKQQPTTADYARLVLSSGNEPLTLQDLLLKMRNLGWKGSGKDKIDRRRIYAAIYDQEDFGRYMGGTWGLKS